MKIKNILSAIIVAAAFIFAGQSAQAGSPLRFGVKGGLTVNSLKFNSDLLGSENSCGWTAGVMTKFNVPVIGLGFDASLMYTHRAFGNTDISIPMDDGTVIKGENLTANYIEIPVNLRWDISIPAVGKIITPFITTGPDFSFLTSKKNVDNIWKEQSFDVAWNFGFGVLLVDHLQLHASYGIGLKNSASGADSLYNNNIINGKNRFWTVTAAYLF